MAEYFDNYILSKSKILHEIKPNTGRKTMCGKKLKYALHQGNERNVRHRYPVCSKCLSAHKYH